MKQILNESVIFNEENGNLNLENKNNHFVLTEEEVEQAMVINKFSLDLLYKLLGLTTLSQNLTTSVLCLERLGYSNTTKGFLEEITELGKSAGENLLDTVQPIICEQWDYCRRISTDGLGDPRRLVQALAQLIEPKLYEEGITTRSALIAACVFVARSNLSQLCRCSDR